MNMGLGWTCSINHPVYIYIIYTEIYILSMLTADAITGDKRFKYPLPREFDQSTALNNIHH